MRSSARPLQDRTWNVVANSVADIQNVQVLVRCASWVGHIIPLEQIYNLLHRLGSDTIEKFHVSRLLRSGQSDTRFIFLLWRLSHQMGEPFRTRCQSQLRLVFKFRHTEAPPANIPMRFYICSDDMASAIKDWVLNFTFRHAVNFPPFHKVRAPFVRIKSKSLGQYMFNFRSHLTWWTPETTGQCCCHLFPKHIQAAERQTTHITAFASDCFPNVPNFEAGVLELIRFPVCRSDGISDG